MKHLVDESPEKPLHSDAHQDEERHHHHRHASGQHHAGGHHLLQVEDLTVAFRMYGESKGVRGFFTAEQREVAMVRHLSLSIHAGEIVAVVGASGAGKSLVADAILGIFESNALVTGKIWFDGRLQTAESLADLRGRGISLVPQSIESLDPLMRVGRQVRGVGGDVGRQRELFERYGLDFSVERLYPFQLSGGMARRVLLCCALMESPKVVIADEPTPGLDLPLAMRAMEDFRSLADQGTGVLLITHDIELALRTADRVAVFKDGTVVEEAPVTAFQSPDTLEHPFSRMLWHAMAEHDFLEGECFDA